jgi:cystathionine beta-synthase
VDVLVIVGDPQVPERWLVRARRQLRVPAGRSTESVIAELRPRIPRSIGVIGEGAEGVEFARQLHRAGLPVTLIADRPSAPPGVDVIPLSDPGAPMEVAGSLRDLVGNTPLLRLDRIGADLACHLLAKLEMLNPGGSVKDRAAVAMIDAAEADGLLHPGGTIVEPTSGNTGVGLAVVAARRGYRCIFTMPDKVSVEKVQLLRAYGAEVIMCPTTVAPDHPDSYYSVARSVTAATAGAFQPNQYANPANPRAHEASTGPEIWRQTAGRVTHFVASIGTGGTISGAGRYLKSRRADVQVVGADPEGSVYSGGSGRPYLVEGIGEDFWPTTYDPAVVDRVIPVTDRDSFLTARRVTRDEGLLVGGSSGTAVWAALTVGRELGPEAVVVVLLPDSGRGYLSKIYDDTWMADRGFLRAGGDTIDTVLAAKGALLPPLVHIHPDETVRAAISLLREFGISQMPVIKAEPPLSLAEMVGAVGELQLLERVYARPEVIGEAVATAMEPPLPVVGTGEPVDRAVAELRGSPAVVVVDGGHPVGILTRSDLLDFVARGQL